MKELETYAWLALSYNRPGTYLWGNGETAGPKEVNFVIAPEYPPYSKRKGKDEIRKTYPSG